LGSEFQFQSQGIGISVHWGNCYVFEENSETFNVFSYNPELRLTARNVCFAHDDSFSGQVILLIVHQGFHIPHLGYSLIAPFQMRGNDVIVNDWPKFQRRSPTEDDHCVIIARDDLTTYSMPLSLRGTTSLLELWGRRELCQRLDQEAGQLWDPRLLPRNGIHIFFPSHSGFKEAVCSIMETAFRGLFPYMFAPAFSDQVFHYFEVMVKESAR
jgi:hypothetical protein